MQIQIQYKCKYSYKYNTQIQCKYKLKCREFQQRISESQEVHGKMRTQLHLVDKEVFAQKLNPPIKGSNGHCLHNVILIMVVKRYQRWTASSTSLASLRKLSRVHSRLSPFILELLIGKMISNNKYRKTNENENSISEHVCYLKNIFFKDSYINHILFIYIIKLSVSRLPRRG